MLCNQRLEPRCQVGGLDFVISGQDVGLPHHAIKHLAGTILNFVP
jgi:hypothetical protein